MCVCLFVCSDAFVGLVCVNACVAVSSDVFGIRHGICADLNPVCIHARVRARE